MVYPFIAALKHVMALDRTIAMSGSLNGLAMPPDLKTGAYQLIDLADTPSASLYEGKVVTDKKFGHATYGCMICCGHNGLQLNPSPVYSVLYGSAALDAAGMDACGGGTLQNLDGYADPSSGMSDNTSYDCRAKASNRGKHWQRQRIHRVKGHPNSMHLEASRQSNREDAMPLGLATVLRQSLRRDSLTEVPQHNPRSQKPTVAIQIEQRSRSFPTN
jgi:hypothetical protein